MVVSKVMSLVIYHAATAPDLMLVDRHASHALIRRFGSLNYRHRHIVPLGVILQVWAHRRPEAVQGVVARLGRANFALGGGTVAKLFIDPF